MDKEYREFLKEHDPIHYSEMMGDPVTGLNSDNSSGIELVLLVIFLIGIGFVFGVNI